MRHATRTRAVAVILLGTTLALAPALADARPGVRGGGATSISATPPNVPATNDAIAAIPSAGPALPCRAIW